MYMTTRHFTYHVADRNLRQTFLVKDNTCSLFATVPHWHHKKLGYANLLYNCYSERVMFKARAGGQAGRRAGGQTLLLELTVL